MKKRALCILIGLLILFGVFVADAFFLEPSAYEVTKTEIQSADLPEALEGLCIVQVSDLHSRLYGENGRKLYRSIADQEPDLIVITGDLIDKRNQSFQDTVSFVVSLCEIAPVYYVSGNHEYMSQNYPQLADELKSGGVLVLENERAEFQKNGASITVAGLSDPCFLDNPNRFDSYMCQTEQLLRELNFSPEEFTLLLAHRPELFEIYSAQEIDLVLSGHTHGGQIRLPIVGALFAPNQGFFPAYDMGLYEAFGTQMYVSRGFGGFVRFLCRPELAVVQLHRA